MVAVFYLASLIGVDADDNTGMAKRHVAWFVSLKTDFDS